MAAPANKPAVKSDLRKRAAISAGRLASASAEASATAVETLDELHESLNKRVDAEVEVLSRGALTLVGLAEIGGKDAFRTGFEGFEADSKAESLIRATENLLSLSHTLKLLFLLNDDDNEAAQAKRKASKADTLREIEVFRTEAEGRIKAYVDNMH